MSLRPADLIAAIEDSFRAAWEDAKRSPLPDAGRADRRLLFAAVADGLLAFLENHQDEVLQSITFQEPGQDPQTRTVVAARFDIVRRGA